MNRLPFGRQPYDIRFPAFSLPPVLFSDFPPLFAPTLPRVGFSASGKRVSPTPAEPALSGVFFSVTGRTGTSSFLNIYMAHKCKTPGDQKYRRSVRWFSLQNPYGFPEKTLENHLNTPWNPEIIGQLPLKFPYKN